MSDLLTQRERHNLTRVGQPRFVTEVAMWQVYRL